MRLLKLAFPFLGLAMIGACGSDSDGNGNCTDYSGRWSISGNCPDVTECDVEQTGCRVTFNCNDNSELSGRVRGDSIEFSNSDVDCSINIGNVEQGEQPEGSGSCEIQGGASCSFNAECESGKCLDAGNGGSGGSGGSGGRGGSGGSGGGEPLDPECELGTNAFCTCAEAAGEPCTNAEAEAAYELCVAEDPRAETILCFGDQVYIDEDGEETINCGTAEELCLPTGPGGEALSVRRLR
jgi:hypothetical protein